MIELCSFLHAFYYRGLILICMNGIMKFLLCPGKLLIFLSPELYEMCFKQENITDKLAYRGPHFSNHRSLLSYCDSLHHGQAVNHIGESIMDEYIHPDLETRHIPLACPRDRKSTRLNSSHQINSY